jgi:hypothetical protein
MKTLGARLASVAPSEVAIELPFRADLTQQHGSLHAGIVASVGRLALSLSEVLLKSRMREIYWSGSVSGLVEDSCIRRRS